MAVFDENTDVTTITLDSLVGDDKKFKTPDDLARAKFESDRVILAREREMAELREELAKRKTTEELFEQIKQRTPPVERQATEDQPPAVTPPLTDEDLAARIRAITQQDSVAQRTQKNLEDVTAGLVELYGDEDKANEVVKRRAQELGVPVTFLEDVAKQGPTAFFATLGVQSPKGTPGAPRSDVNTASFSENRGGPKPGTYGYYQALAKTMKPEEYFSPRIQNQLMKDAFAAEARGEDFYKT